MTRQRALDYDNISRDIGDSLSMELFALLKSWGVKARINNRVKDVELMSISGHGTTFCIIEIEEGPIRWISIQWKAKTKLIRDHLGHILDNSYDRYYYVACSIEYGIPDQRLTTHLVGELMAQLRIQLGRIRILPIVGKIISVRWKGNDVGMGIITWLNQDISLKKSLVTSPELEITAQYYDSRWIMSVKASHLPSQKLWDCYQSIARHLLAKWL
ncbi:hypothetical protein ACFLYX_02690 [Chloroflexota bacterium]